MGKGVADAFMNAFNGKLFCMCTYCRYKSGDQEHYYFEVKYVCLQYIPEDFKCE